VDAVLSVGRARLAGDENPLRSRTLSMISCASDIQSLADPGNSYALVRDMRPVSFSLEDV